MELKSVTLMWIVVSIVQLIGFLLTLIGYASNYIVSISKARELAHSGIWTGCLDTKDGIQCLDVVDFVERTKGNRVWVDASRGMMTISFICQLLTILLTTTALRCTPTKYMCWVTSIVAGFSVLNGIIGVAVAAGQGSSFMEDTFKVVQIVGYLLTLIGYASKYIVSLTQDRESIHTGIWTGCVTQKDTCVNLADLVERTGHSRGKGNVVYRVSFFVVLLTSLALCRTPTKLMCWVTSGVGVFSAVNGFIGVAVAAGRSISFFEEMDKNANLNVDWSFILYFLGSCTFLLTSIWHYINGRNSS
ncbi:hypothetical protein Bpfe_029702 [Biomphalaria pfeifferi]|uniref:Claudin n=1 Tax=Biomphalaria pfeifferi TaxID=112525 RepID=A0AAD8EUI6_BIOPF|nr:hypothetical protein Bpfe_029702 [Biomphalaria pfeifferi]